MPLPDFYRHDLKSVIDGMRLTVDAIKRGSGRGGFTPHFGPPGNTDSSAEEIERHETWIAKLQGILDADAEGKL